MAKSNISRLESILSALYNSGRYVLAILATIALVEFSERYYGAQEVAMSFTLYLIAVGVTASAFFNWVFGDRK